MTIIYAKLSLIRKTNRAIAKALRIIDKRLTRLEKLYLKRKRHGQ